MNRTIEELKTELLIEEVKEVVKQAYLQGLEEGKVSNEYPPLLTKKDLSKIFQVEISTVNKIIGRKGFPKSNFVAGRYPRDDVFRWMSDNCQRYN